MNRFFKWSLLLFLLGVFTACAPYQVNHKFVGSADLSQAKNFYVAHNPDDTTPLDIIIEEEIHNLGFFASCGEKEKMPDDTDVLVTYEFHWFWDITNYLLQFEIEFRDPATEYPLARGESWRASLARKSPQEMAGEILGPLLLPAPAAE